jgi:hypothetical protein
MKITPTTLTLSQLFSSGNEQFLIPAYQRRYSWQEKQKTGTDLFNSWARYRFPRQIGEPLSGTDPATGERATLSVEPATRTRIRAHSRVSA